MSKRARMGELAGMLLAPEDRTEEVVAPPPPKTEEQKTAKPKTKKLVFRKPEGKAPGSPMLAEAVDVDRPYGERGDFEKVTVTLPSDVRALLLDESLRRKKQRSADWPIAAIVREAIASYLNGKRG